MAYNPSKHTTTNKSIGISGKPVDGRTYFLNESMGIYRQYISEIEVLEYLNTDDYKKGSFLVVINSTGVENPSTGEIEGGTNVYYRFNAELNLVRQVDHEDIAALELAILNESIERSNADMSLLGLINTKADTAYVNAQLDLKVDTDDVLQPLVISYTDLDSSTHTEYTNINYANKSVYIQDKNGELLEAPTNYTGFDSNGVLTFVSPAPIVGDRWVIIGDLGDLSRYATKQEVYNKQDVIKTSTSSFLNWEPYRRNCAFTSGGDVTADGNQLFLSVYQMPIAEGVWLKVVDATDITSSKRVIYYDATDTIIRVDTKVNYAKSEIITPVGTTKISIGFISDGVNRNGNYGQLFIASSPNRAGLLIDNKINGFQYKDRITQNFIAPDKSTSIDLVEHVRYESFNSLGEPTVVGNELYRSIINVPITAGKYYRIVNFQDITSNKRYFFRDGAGALIGSTTIVTNFNTIQPILAPVGAVTMSFVHISDTVVRSYINECYLLQADAATDFSYTKINGIEIYIGTDDVLLKQNLIVPSSATKVNWEPYRRNCAFNESGAIVSDGNINFISAYQMPVTAGEWIKVINALDTSGNKRVVYYDNSDTILSVETKVDYAMPIMKVPSGATKMSINFVANGNIKGQLLVYKASTRGALLFVGNINGFNAYVKDLQSFVKPEKVTLLDITEYQLNMSLDSSGLPSVVGNERFLTAFQLPVTSGSVIRIVNVYDITTNKRLVWYDGSRNVISHLAVQDFNADNMYFIVPATAVYMSVVLLANWTQKYYPSIQIMTSEFMSDFNYSRINFMPIKPEGSEDKISSISVGGQVVPPINGNVALPNAAQIRSGLMSFQDKINLDGVIDADFQQQIDDINTSISGQGGIVVENSWTSSTTNAPSTNMVKTRFEEVEAAIAAGAKSGGYYGMSPSNTANENSIAFQAMLDGGGLMVVSEPGEYKIDSSHFYDSNTELILAPGVIFSSELNSLGRKIAYPLVNRTAFTRTWTDNVKIKGFRIKTNGNTYGNDIARILGLRGFIAGFYVRNMEVEDFYCDDYNKDSFALHFCTWQNLRVINPYFYGEKDGLHLGKGDRLYVKNISGSTFDDLMALNAHDFIVSNPQVGDITNVVVEGLTELPRHTTNHNGLTCRMLPGSWLEWFEGMTVRTADTVLSEGRIYRVNMPVDGATYISNTRPTHTTYTTVNYDGIGWYMCQDDDPVLHATIKNVTFKDVLLTQKKTTAAWQAPNMDSNFFRSVYPSSTRTYVQNIRIEGLVAVSSNIPRLVEIGADLDRIVLNNIRIKAGEDNVESIIYLRDHAAQGMPQTKVTNAVLSQGYYEGGITRMVRLGTRTGVLTIRDSYKADTGFQLIINSGFTIIANDLV